MADQPGFDRRALLRGGVTATAIGAIGLGAAGFATAAPTRPRAIGAKAAEPRIYTTAEWGAREPDQEIVIEDHKPTYIAIHHTADPGNSEDYSLEHAMQIARDIQNFHMDGRGWGDTGQQFTNSRGGFVMEGRHQSLDVTRGGTQHVQGANVANRNSEVTGIENEGIYTDVDVPPALWNSLVPLVTWIAGQYAVPVENIWGHRDFQSTECPGNILYGRLQELRDAVAAGLGLQSAIPELWPLLRPGDSGPQVRAAQHLLRARGFNGVPVDGVFGTATKQAVAKLAEVHGVERHMCSATRHSKVDETGYLGSDIWPLITPRVQPGENNEVAKALSSLRRTGARVQSSLLSQSDWKALLGR